MYIEVVQAEPEGRKWHIQPAVIADEHESLKISLNRTANVSIEKLKSVFKHELITAGFFQRAGRFKCVSKWYTAFQWHSAGCHCLLLLKCNRGE